MHNKLILRETYNKIILINIFIYNFISSLLNILDSDVLVQLIEHQKIKYDYKTIISIISSIINTLYFIVFIICSFNCFERTLS